MEVTDIGKESAGHSDSSVEFGVYPQLKSLYLAYSSWLSDEIIILFASNFPNLILLDLRGVAVKYLKVFVMFYGNVVSLNI